VYPRPNPVQNGKTGLGEDWLVLKSFRLGLGSGFAIRYGRVWTGVEESTSNLMALSGLTC